MIEEALTIGPDTQVTLHFAIKLEDGSVVDSTFDNEPATFSFGDGSLLPGFEDALQGMEAGDENSFIISPEQGFGQRNPNNVQRFKRDDFAADMELEEGLMISFADAQKAELPGVISKLQDELVEVDFNHPLAGKNVVFDVKIIAVGRCQSAPVH